MWSLSIEVGARGSLELGMVRGKCPLSCYGSSEPISAVSRKTKAILLLVIVIAKAR